jgi:hypothetical protein
MLIRNRGKVFEVRTVSSYFHILEPPKMILEDYEGEHYGNDVA